MSMRKSAPLCRRWPPAWRRGWSARTCCAMPSPAIFCITALICAVVQTLRPSDMLDHADLHPCGRDVGMAEQRLYDAQISAVMQKMAGEGMAQHVRADQPRRQAGGRRQFLRVRGKCCRVRCPLSPNDGNSHFEAGLFFDAGPFFEGVPLVLFSCFSACIAARYSAIACREGSFSGTSRSLLPLPRTTIIRASRRNTASGNETSSDTRRPVA